MTIVRVAVFNLKNAGWNPKIRFHDHSKLLDTLAQVPEPHILFLPECTHYHWFDEEPLWEVTGLLSDLLPGNDCYRPFLSLTPGRKHHAGLFVSASMVEPISWHRPGVDTRTVMENFLHCRVAGEEAWLNTVHWSGSGGPHWFDIQSAQLGNMGAKPTLAAGDFNCASSAEPVQTAWQWYRLNLKTPWKLRQKARRRNGLWTPQTEPYDDLLENGFWDAAQLAGDPTPTVNEGSNQLIDRVAASHLLPARLVEGTYRVIVPEPGTEVSDHRLVYVELEFGQKFIKCYDAPVRPRRRGPLRRTPAARPATTAARRSGRRAGSRIALR
jgi:hypothetical protein